MTFSSMGRSVPDLKESRRSLIRCLIIASVGLGLFGGLSWHRAVLDRRICARLDEINKAGYPASASELNQWTHHFSPEGNAALKILEAYDAMSTEPPKPADLSWIGRKPSFPLDAAIKNSFQQVSSNNAQALALLDQAAELPQGDFLVDWSPGPSTLLPHLAKLKSLAALARVKARLALNEKNTSLGVQALFDMLTLADSVASEPCMVSQLVRIHCLTIAVGELELLLNRCALAQGQLTELIKHFQDAERDNQKGVSRAVAGERCLGIGIFQLPSRTALSYGAELPKSVSMLYPLFELAGVHDRDFLFYLKEIDKWTDVAQAPYPARLRNAERVAGEVGSESSNHRLFLLSPMLLPSLTNILEKQAGIDGQLRRAELGMSIEYYRLQHDGNTPDTLERLSPEFLPAVPTDPFTGKPFRYERRTRGYTISRADGKGEDDSAFRVER